MLNKEKIKSKMLDILHEKLNDLQSQIETLETSSDIDEDDTIDPEDLSHQTDAQNQINTFNQQVHITENQISFLKSIDFYAFKEPELGAIVQTDKLNFILSIPTLTFEFEGKKYIGVSQESPFYTEVIHKKIGDKMKLGEKTFKITGIY